MYKANRGAVWPFISQPIWTPSISFQDQAHLLLRLENIWILVLPIPILNPVPDSLGGTEQSQGQQLGCLDVEVGGGAVHMMDEAASPKASSQLHVKGMETVWALSPGGMEEGSPGPTCTYPGLEPAQSLPSPG